jgi:signal transduction histidine kinase
LTAGYAPATAPVPVATPIRLGGRTTQPEGTGLGLSIVRSVVTAHHGQVTALPRPGGGLEISVLLPANLPG